MKIKMKIELEIEIDGMYYLPVPATKDSPHESEDFEVNKFVYITKYGEECKLPYAIIEDVDMDAVIAEAREQWIKEQEDYLVLQKLQGRC